MKKATEATVKFVEGLKRQWMATVDALIDPLMIVERDYTISKVNRALALHADKDMKNLVGKKCYQVLAGRRSPCPGCSMRKAWDTREHQQFTLDGIIKDRYHEVTSQPVIDGNGKLEGIVQIYRDRTEARRMQDQLLQHEKLASIGLLAGGIAHELNNPLGGILIFSQMLLREMAKESSHYPDVVEIEAAAQRCKTIVQNLLDFARKQPETGGKEKKENVDVQDAMLAALRFATVGRLGENVDVVEEWAEEKFQILGNRNRLIQLFLNLIQNALQAMPSGGTLTLKSQSRRDKTQELAAFEVIDTGVGIPAENLKKIFDPFFTSKGVGEGTGLGLSICHGLVEDLGGKIEVESKVNEGSVFRILIPLKTRSKKSA